MGTLRTVNSRHVNSFLQEGATSFFCPFCARVREEVRSKEGK